MPSNREVRACFLGMTRAGVAACVLASVIGTAVGAPAQTPPKTTAAWRVECSGDGKTIECRAVQQIFRSDTRQLLVSVVVRHPQGAKSPVMMIQLPLGLNLTEPISIRVDNGPAERQPIQTCTNIGCFVGMSVADKMLAALRSGRLLKLTVFDVNKKPVEMALPLLGFALAYDKAK